MELTTVDVTEAPKTPEEKIEWLWDRLDELIQANANFASTNQMLEQRVATLEAALDSAQASTRTLTADLQVAYTELNGARAAAASAVEEYRAQTEE